MRRTTKGNSVEDVAFAPSVEQLDVPISPCSHLRNPFNLPNLASLAISITNS
jgi:hypothetical protein